MKHIDLVGWHLMESNLGSCTAIPTTLPAFLGTQAPSLDWLIGLVCCDGVLSHAALYVLPLLFDLLTEANEIADEEQLREHCALV